MTHAPKRLSQPRLQSRLYRVALGIRVSRTKGRVGTFRGAYDMTATLSFGAAVARGLAACGLPVGEKSHSLTAANMQRLKCAVQKQFCAWE